jgi:hypothetical protein
MSNWIPIGRPGAVSQAPVAVYVIGRRDGKKRPSKDPTRHAAQIGAASG